MISQFILHPSTLLPCYGMKGLRISWLLPAGWSCDPVSMEPGDGTKSTRGYHYLVVGNNGNY